VIQELQSDFGGAPVWARSLEEQLDIRTRHMQMQAREIEEFTQRVETQRQGLARQSDVIGRL